MKPTRVNKPRLAIAALLVLAGLFVLAVLFRGAGRLEPDAMQPIDPKPSARLSPPCSYRNFEAVAYVHCLVDLSVHDVRLFHANADKHPWGDVEGLVAHERAKGQAPLMVMNAGMYHPDMTPVGLLVEQGRQISPLNTADDTGNFFLKPNGVFFVDAEGRPGVMETLAYARAAIAPHIATQSGPMLVIDGRLHPRFLADGTSRYIRNGVGVRADGRIVLAMSLAAVNLHGFARAFRDGFDCPDALFFDGDVSTLAAGDAVFKRGNHPAGPVVAVFERSNRP